MTCFKLGLLSICIVASGLLSTTAEAQVPLRPQSQFTGQRHISSSNTGTNSRNGLNINQFLGAERFYNNGYTGTNAIMANIEAGHARPTHEVLSHITEQVTGNGALGSVDRHATAVSHAMGGRRSPDGYPNQYDSYGIGYGSELWTGAIATEFLSGGRFRISNASTASTYSSILQTGVNGQTADVFNSSWGFTEPTGNNTITRGVDGLINDNRKIGVVSAGNSGSGGNTVGGIGAGYNSITVGAMGSDTAANPYDSISGFSSRGPNDFFDAANNQVISGVRAAVDIAAPGQNLTLATESSDTSYRSNWAGTSFSAPIVAGGAALVVDAGKQVYGTEDAIDGRVVKAVLMNSADKTTGWDNGQFDDNGVIRTDQGLDYALGAGRLNLDAVYDQYMLTPEGGLAETADVFGLGKGDLGNVGRVGWDYGEVLADAGEENLYYIDSELAAGSEFTATLTWFADRNTGDPGTFTANSEDHLANLDLSIFEFDNLTDRNIIGEVAVSESLYNVSEHLNFLLVDSGFYGIRVTYTDSHWDFGTLETAEQYGLAWSSSAAAVPEPASLPLLALGSMGLLYWRRRKAKMRAKQGDQIEPADLDEIAA